MHNLDLILTLTGGLAAALAGGFLTYRLGLSPIVGYLLAGVVVGPYTPGFVADHQMAEQLAEIGVILLMFGVGLEFHLDQLLAVRRVAIPGALVQSLFATGLGALVAVAFGWSWGAGIVYGLALSVASTVVLMRVLADSRDLQTPIGHIAVGWLVVEDVFTVIILVLLPALFGPEQSALADLPLVLGLVLLKIAALVGFTFLAGGRAIPWLLRGAAITRSRELFSLTVLVIALGIAVGSAKLFGVSMALGAFLAGMVVGRSEFSHRAATDALPMRDAFAVLFFVSIGMLLDPQKILAAPGLLFGTLAIIMIGKPLAAFALVALLRYPLKTGLAVATVLSQIGEFSFMVAAVGKQLGLLNDSATNTIVAAAIISITLNPLLYRAVTPLHTWLTRRRAASSNEVVESVSADALLRSGKYRSVVVGYGPVGQTVARLLSENNIEPTIIELNIDTTRSLKESGIRAVYGDASQRETLKAAGIQHALGLVLTSSGTEGSEDIIRAARELNPTIRVLARTTYIHQLDALRRAGAQSVFAAEVEVALALATEILDRLGATAEQIDRERARVHLDLSGAK